MKFSKLLEERQNRVDNGLCPLHGVKVQSMSRCDKGEVKSGSYSYYTCPHRECDVELRMNVFGMWELAPQWRYLLDEQSCFSIGRPYKVKIAYPRTSRVPDYAWLIQIQSEYHLIAHMMESHQDLLVPTFGNLDQEHYQRLYTQPEQKWSMSFCIVKNVVEELADMGVPSAVPNVVLTYDTGDNEASPIAVNNQLKVREVRENHAVNAIYRQVDRIAHNYVRSLYVPHVFLDHINSIKDF